MLTIIAGAVGFSFLAGLGQFLLSELVHRNQEWFGYDSSGEYGLPKKTN
jgi:hypothetical protein